MASFVCTTYILNICVYLCDRNRKTTTVTQSTALHISYMKNDGTLNEFSVISKLHLLLCIMIMKNMVHMLTRHMNLSSCYISVCYIFCFSVECYWTQEFLKSCSISKL